MLLTCQVGTLLTKRFEYFCDSISSQKYERKHYSALYEPTLVQYVAGDGTQAAVTQDETVDNCTDEHNNQKRAP